MPLSPPRGSTAGSRPIAGCARIVGGLPGAQVDSKLVVGGAALIAVVVVATMRRRLGVGRDSSSGYRPCSWSAGSSGRGHPPAPPTGLRLTVLDVGQGDAILLQVPEGSILVDQGLPKPRSTTRSVDSASAGWPCSRSPIRNGTMWAARRGARACASGPSWIRRSRTRARTRQQRSRPRVRGEFRSSRLGPESSSGSAGFGSGCSGPTALTRRASIPTSVPR